MRSGFPLMDLICSFFFCHFLIGFFDNLQQVCFPNLFVWRVGEKITCVVMYNQTIFPNTQMCGKHQTATRFHFRKAN